MQTAFLIEYIAWVFVSTIGVLQFVAVQSKLWGLLFLRSQPKATKICSILLLVFAFIWYFEPGDRNQPDTGLGLDANIQAFWFTMSAAAAAGTTLALTSITNHGWGKKHGWDRRLGEAPPIGLTWLSQTTYFHAIRARMTHRGRRAVDRAGK
mgnify:CR=1 FL=1|jgi:hypothetical protein